MLYVVCHKYESALKFCYQLAHCHLIQYLLVGVHITKCFMKSSRWFWFELMLKNKHILLMNTPPELQMVTAAAQQPWWHWSKCHRASWKRGNSWFYFCTVVCDSCLGCILNGTLCALQCTHSSACLPPQSEDLWFQFSDTRILHIYMLKSIWLQTAYLRKYWDCNLRMSLSCSNSPGLKHNFSSENHFHHWQ
jgi:hypothetical protein